MDSRAESMHVQARTPVMFHSVIVHSRTSLLGPVVQACLFHDHAKCSCIGGSRRLVQSHFTCHSHERSSCVFVMLMHRTHKHQSLLHLVFSFCCSSVSVLSRVPVEMFCLAWKTFHVTDASCARWSLHRELSQHFVHDIQHFVSFIKQTE